MKLNIKLRQWPCANGYSWNHGCYFIGRYFRVFFFDNSLSKLCKTKDSANFKSIKCKLSHHKKKQILLSANTNSTFKHFSVYVKSVLLSIPTNIHKISNCSKT